MKFITMRRCIILFIGVIILFSTYYLIGLRNKKNIAYNNPKTIKMNPIKNATTKPKAPEKKKEDLLPKTPGGQELYHLINVDDGQNVAYLTFDDGPSPNNTPKILDLLKKENIKATFFIIGKNALTNPELLVREKSEGHSVGMHSYSHEPAIIYKNPQAYLDDLQQCSDAMTKAVGPEGYDKWLVRFPYGSSTVKNKPGFADSIGNAGYHYVDWNAENGDAELPRMASSEYLMRRLSESIGKQHHVVILMHDASAKSSTADTLPQIIEYLKSHGFIFKAIPTFQS
ncbi:polysaccharide deacetylase family protein [Clostridium sp.]|jgi:peptidoglycan/xylan/chitin deacetylase (PgdA/CDA1 family)|uniref:polysaccharide deacetylase family protein n=1 Tax=Clostridium sp. TaxID=1506 RepID=UPI00259008CB|nr:polysaccharide deacetylase family protein [Clostridium sp.]MDF2505369.1 pgdA2 [Clostridium sp.]